jgi:hypothetical protein
MFKSRIEIIKYNLRAALDRLFFTLHALYSLTSFIKKKVSINALKT